MKKITQATNDFTPLAKRKAAEHGKPLATGINIPELAIHTLSVRVNGLTPLLCNNFGKKVQEEMLARHEGKTVTANGDKVGRKHKDVKALFLASLYTYPGGGYGFPSIGFKAGMINAANTILESLKKTTARSALYIPGELVKIYGKPVIDIRPVRNFGGKPDMRVRARFDTWHAILTIKFNSSVLSQDEVVNLVNHAGFSCGIGDGRMQKGNSGMNYGMYEITR